MVGLSYLWFGSCLEMLDQHSDGVHAEHVWPQLDVDVAVGPITQSAGHDALVSVGCEGEIRYGIKPTSFELRVRATEDSVVIASSGWEQPSPSWRPLPRGVCARDPPPRHGDFDPQPLDGHWLTSQSKVCL
jgi:hypothetical protein